MMAMVGLGCQQGVEVDFVRPQLTSIEPASVRRSTGHLLRLQLGLLGEPAQSLSPTDRVLAGSATIWLNNLKKENFVVSNSTVVELGFDRPPLSTLHIVVDNSEAAARWDPQEHRLAALRSWVDSLKAMVDGGLVQVAEVSLLVLQQGQVHFAVKEGTVAQVIDALSKSPLLPAPGGRAPLWDGLLAAPGRVLLYWGSSGDGDSGATFDQVRTMLSTANSGALVAIAGPQARTRDLRELVSVCQGVLLEAATPQAIPVQFRTASALIAGQWTLALDAAPEPSTSGHIAGVVELHAGGQRWSQSFRLPLLEP